MTTLTAGSTANFSLSGRQVLTLTSDNNTTGTIKRTQYVESSSSKTDTLGPPATNRTYGPFGHETDIELTCTYGSFEYDVTGTSLVTAETDPVTGGLRNFEGAQGISFGQSNIRSQKILTRAITGRCAALALSDATYPANSNTNGMTMHFRVALADHFDAIRIGIPNMSGSAQAGVTCGVSATDSLGAWASTAPTGNGTGANVSAAPSPSETPGTAGEKFYVARFNGAASATLLASTDATNLVPSYTWTDWAPVASVARTDGGSLPLADVRLFYPAGSSPSLAYNGSTYSSWAIWGRADLVTSGRVYRVFSQAVEAVATPANFTSVTSIAYNVPILIQYKSRNGGVGVLRLGDSIFDGGSSTYQNNGFAWQAFLGVANSNPSMAFEEANLSVPGQKTYNIWQVARQLLPQVAPSVCAFQSSSVNNYGTSLGARVQQHGKGSLGMFLALCAENRTSPLTFSMLPVTYAAKAWGATDSQRVTLNSYLSNQAEIDRYTYVDFGPVYDGSLNTGQVEPNASYISGDGIHPNDAGHVALAVPYQTGLVSSMAKS